MNSTGLKFEMTYIDQPFFDHVKALTRDTVRHEIGNYLEGGAVDALMLRHDQIVRVSERLARQKGSSQVFLAI
jgi:hypothetical protein